ncbi:unnamed protein product [Lathyrus sativus]|nr:unnamed protein product [Lathyrus sativus]
MKTLIKQNKTTKNQEGETNRADSCMFQSNVLDPPLADDQHLVKNNVSEDVGQGKKKKKKKRSGVSKHNCEDGDDGKKMKKKPRLIEGNTFNECNHCRSNEGEDGEQGNKLKKKNKKLSEESKHKDYNEVKSNDCEDVGQGKKVKKKKKLIEEGRFNHIRSNEDGDDDQGETTKKNHLTNKKSKTNDDESKAVTSESPNSAHNGTCKPKRVTFSDQVEEFCYDGLVCGKRYTPEEDEKIRASVYDFIDSHGLGDEGVDMILHSRQHSSIKGCWKVIAKVLPERPKESVIRRARNLFESNEKFKWTPYEIDFIRKAHEQNGPNWRGVANALGKSQYQIADAWRKLKFTKRKKGRWSQEEYQTLFNLVNTDLRTRALEPYRKSKHGMLRDNICWEAIGNKLETRNSALCCSKWYDQLTSTMVASGDWCDTDDFRLVEALYALDACSMEEVDWDDLLEHRSGDVCRKRWDQMVQHIGDRVGKSFIEQVEILSKRFCPDLLEARETFDNKPVTC